MVLGGDVAAQQLLDRVLAVVEGTPVTLSDVRAMQGLGIVDAADDAGALEQAIDRQLLLYEVQRFPPPEPPAAAIDAEAAALLARPGLPALMRETGLDERRVREMARERLRIRGYLEQRFGTSVQVSDEEVDRYYREHQDEFLRDGLLIPFAEAEPVARDRASAERLTGLIDDWMAELRTRADVRRLDGRS
ncbi:MAG: hypothetical protein AB7P99_14840 [Vicinamibacterales bacterium]